MPDPDGRFDAESVLAQLVALEPIFHAPGGMTRAQFDTLTAADFAEVGASGRRYNREEVWAVLARRAESGVPEPVFELTRAAVRRLAEHAWVLTYDLRFDGRHSRRVSVWEWTDAQWRVVYHQGTAV